MKLPQPFHSIVILAFSVAIVRVALATEPQASIDALQAKRSGGVAIAIVTADKVEFYQSGTFSSSDSSPVGPDTLFEIGSVTKIFTAIQLADAIERGVVKLDDTIGAPFAKSSITYRQLATHTSGLPTLPAGFRGHDKANPYATYTVASLVSEFAAAAPKAKPSPHNYSNFGFAILGQAVATANNESWPVSLQQRVLKPLGLSDTFWMCREADAKRLAPGHTQSERVSSWTFDAYAPAGSIVSSTRDMSRFIRAMLGQFETPLKPALAATLQRVVWNDTSKQSNGLGLLLPRSGTNEIAQHSGQTGGYHSFVGLNLQRQRGVIILTNDASDTEPISKLGFSLLSPKPSPGKKAAPRKEITLAEDELEACTGRYEFASGRVLTVRRDGHRLAAQLSGQPANPFLPEAKDRFFHKAIDAQLTFERDASGSVAAVVLHQNGNEQRASRVK